MADHLRRPARVTPRLVVVERFAKQAPAAQFRFVVGRALATLISRTMYLQLLKPRLLEAYLAAIVQPFERGFGHASSDPNLVEELARRANRIVGRRGRRSIEEAARTYMAAEPIEISRWRWAAARSAERCGLLFSGDVAAALAVLASEPIDERARGELLQFAIGPQLDQARRQIGLGH